MRGFSDEELDEGWENHDASLHGNKYWGSGEEEERNTNDIWGEDESVTRNKQNYESEEEIQTVGDSDMSTLNTSMEMERSEQMSDDDESHVTNQEGVRDSWEEDSILNNIKEIGNE